MSAAGAISHSDVFKGSEGGQIALSSMLWLNTELFTNQAMDTERGINN